MTAKAVFPLLNAATLIGSSTPVPVTITITGVDCFSSAVLYVSSAATSTIPVQIELIEIDPQGQQRVALAVTDAVSPGYILRYKIADLSGVQYLFFAQGESSTGSATITATLIAETT